MTDTAILDALADWFHDAKWDDFCEELRPRDIVDDEALEKYINKNTFRAMLTTSLRRKGYPHA